MVHPLGKRPCTWFGPDDYTDGDDIAAEMARRQRIQAEWDAIFYKMGWWKRFCCVLAGEMTEPAGTVPYAFFQEMAPRDADQPSPQHIQFEENTMKNEELLHRRGSRLNSFTRALRDACIEQGTVLVKMRNGDSCRVKFLPADANNEDFEHPYDDAHEGGFLGDGSYRYWQANGESITGERFDIVEFDPIVQPAAADTVGAA